MPTTKAFSITAALLFAASLAQAQTDTPRVDERQARQEQRIDQGVASGELTKREATRLTQQQNHIDRVEDRAKADGDLTKKERARLTHAQNAASRDIARKKHNRRDRN